jgi:hypothetical protein
MYPDANFQHFVVAAKYAEAPITEGVGVRVISDQRTINNFFTTVIFILVIMGSLFLLAMTAELFWPLSVLVAWVFALGFNLKKVKEMAKFGGDAPWKWGILQSLCIIYFTIGCCIFTSKAWPTWYFGWTLVWWVQLIAATLLYFKNGRNPIVFAINIYGGQYLFVIAFWSFYSCVEDYESSGCESDPSLIRKYMLIVSLIAIAICTALLYFNIDFRRNAEHRNNANYVIDFATILAIVPFQQTFNIPESNDVLDWLAICFAVIWFMFLAALNTTHTPLLVALLGIYVMVVKVFTILQSRIYSLYDSDSYWGSSSSSSNNNDGGYGNDDAYNDAYNDAYSSNSKSGGTTIELAMQTVVLGGVAVCLITLAPKVQQSLNALARRASAWCSSPNSSLTDVY